MRTLSTIERFYETIRANGTVGFEEIRLVHNDRRVLSQFYPDWRDVVASYDKLRALNGDGFNVYFSVCPRVEKRGTKDAITAVGVLWADLDFKDFAHGEAEVRERLASFKYEPNVVVHSGHGLHTYWLLRKPTTELERIEQINRAIAAELDGDHVADVSRVMRLPGFLNQKNPAEPIPAILEECQALTDYSLDDFDFLTERKPLVAASRHMCGVVTVEPSSVEHVQLESLKVSREILDLIRDGAETGHRSNAIAACISALIDAQLNDDQIALILLNRAHRISEKCYEKLNPSAWLRERIKVVREYKQNTDTQKPAPSQRKLIKLVSSDSLLSDDSLTLEGVIDDLLYRKTITMLAGAPGAGKSNFALWLASFLASRSITFLSKRDQYRVLYYSLEDPAAETRKRHAFHVETLRPNREAIAFCFDAHGFDEMRDAITSHCASVVVIDSLSVWSLQFSVDENDNAQATKLMRALRQLADETNIALLLIHHVAKPNPKLPVGSQAIWSTIRGAGAYVAQSDVALALNQESSQFVLRYAKNRLSMKNDVIQLIGNKQYGFSLAEADENARANSNTSVILRVVGDDERLIKEEIIDRARREGWSKNKALEALRLAVKNEHLFAEPNPRNRKQLIYRKRASGFIEHTVTAAG